MGPVAVGPLPWVGGFFDGGFVMAVDVEERLTATLPPQADTVTALKVRTITIPARRATFPFYQVRARVCAISETRVL
jgi:hypothetical protein